MVPMFRSCCKQTLEDKHELTKWFIAKPAHIPEIALQYTEEQIDAYQVKLIVDELVRPDDRYREVGENKIFQKQWA